jgi:deoxyribonuclease V
MSLWNFDKDEAKEIQLRLAPLVVSIDTFADIGVIAGVSIRQSDDATVHAAVSVLDFRTMELMTSATASAKTAFPYVPGLRAFQAAPAIIAAFEKLRTRPDIVLWDGHGIAHSRHCGLASHLGIVLNLPSIGVAEKLVYGTCDVAALPQDRGSRIAVLDPTDDTEIGASVRTGSGIRPIFVSVGHRVSLKSAIRLALDCCPRFRIPEPLRQARMVSRRGITP